MGYHLQSLVARSHLLQRNALAFDHARIVQLNQGFEMMMVTAALMDEAGSKISLPPEPHPIGFSMLNQSLGNWAMQVSTQGMLAYIECEYFGGIGTQYAIIWQDGFVVDGPLSGEIGPINRALRLLGARAIGTEDEFVSVGLNRHRHMEDWIGEAECR